MANSSVYLRVAAGSVFIFALGMFVDTEPQQVRAAPRSAPLVGRLRTHDALLDLTLESVQPGGAAFQVGRGVADVIADVERSEAPAGRASER
jgi:hypothetical protein